MTKKKTTASLSTLIALTAPIIGSTSAQAASTTPIKTFTVVNNTDKGDMYVTAIGTIGQGSHVPGFLDSSGTFHAFPAATSKVVQNAPDATMIKLAKGQKITFAMPYGFSGRIYESFNAKLPVQTVLGADGYTGTVQPVPWVKDSAFANLDFDTTELTYFDAGLFINNTQVDMVNTPSSVTGIGSNGTSTVTSMPASAVTQLANALKSVPGFEDSAQYNGSGKLLRVVAPTHLVDTSTKRSTYLDAYISRVWSKYTNESLTIQPDPTHHPELEYTGRVVGSQFIFTKIGDTNSPKIAIDKPSTSNVWGCDGVLNASPDGTVPAAYTDMRGHIARSLCADFTRGVLGTSNVSPSNDASAYYVTNSINGGTFDWYAKYVHDLTPGHKAYAFPFDDVNNQESLVRVDDPTSVIVTMGGSDAATTPTTPATPTNPTNPTTPTTPATPTSSVSANVTVGNTYPGYMTLNLPSGTTAGALDVLVDGKKVSSISVGGAGSIRADVPASPGTHIITVKSTTGSTIGSGFTISVPGGSSTTTPVTPTNPSAPVTTSKSVTTTATFGTTNPGWATLNLGTGTTAGIVTVKIDGGSTSTASVNGSGLIRVDAKASAGTHTVTITSTGNLGSVSFTPGQ